MPELYLIKNELAFLLNSLRNQSVFPLDIYTKVFLPLMKKVVDPPFKYPTEFRKMFSGENGYKVDSLIERLRELDFSGIEEDFWGDVYNEFILAHDLYQDKSIRKLIGSFFTPKWVVDTILDSIPLKNLQERTNFRAIDLACGTGTFLISLQQRIKQHNNAPFMFGVDIDPRAVEIADLNMRIRNISPKSYKLVVADTLKYPQMALSYGETSDEDRKVSSQSYDLVIGNPPYGAKFDKDFKRYLKKNFVTAFGKYESFRFFIEIGIRLLKQEGYLGYIIPNTWLTIIQGKPLRKLILETCEAKEIIDLPQKVFKTTVDTIILILKKQNDKALRDKNTIKATFRSDSSEILHFAQSVFQSSENHEFNIYSQPKEVSLLRKIREGTKKLGEVTKISQGLIPYDKYSGQSEETIKKRIYHSNRKLDENYVREIQGKEVGRYYYEMKRERWLSYGDWLGAPRHPDFFTKPRILIQSTRNLSLCFRIVAAYCEEHLVNSTVLNNIIKKNNDFDLKYILAILNSKLMNWYYSKTFPTTIHIYPSQLKSIPIKKIKTQQRIINLVAEVIMLKRRKADSNEIDQIERNIDFEIYSLYGLNDEEIRVVENHFDRRKG